MVLQPSKQFEAATFLWSLAREPFQESLASRERSAVILKLIHGVFQDFSNWTQYQEDFDIHYIIPSVRGRKGSNTLLSELHN